MVFAYIKYVLKHTYLVTIGCCCTRSIFIFSLAVASSSCFGISGNGQFNIDGFAENELLLLIVSYILCPPEPVDGRIVEHL